MQKCFPDKSSFSAQQANHQSLKWRGRVLFEDSMLAVDVFLNNDSQVCY
jgi:hypothetical protein